MIDEAIRLLVQFGVAGLMGILWVWERFMSRNLIRQLNESHDYLIRQQQELGVLIDIVKQNTEAIERFNQTQKHFKELLVNLNSTIKMHK